MKSIQDYRNIYREIASNLGIQGDSVELLVQLLAQHSYINEVENASYLREASMESAVLMNSKIQHCMDDMYSVFRGECPRLILNFIPLNVLNFHRYDEVAVSSNFRLYYLGYVDEEGNYIYDDCSFYPSLTSNTSENQYQIITLLSQDKVEKEWTTNYLNLYYIDCLEENLSNDMYLTHENQIVPVTRDFATHIVKNQVFDLTLPSFSSRLYIADSQFSKIGEEAEENLNLKATYFIYTTLDSINENEIGRVSISGMKLINPNDKEDFTNGIKKIAEKTRDSVYSLHYKASKDKFISTMIRSNDDICRLFKETFIGYISTNGVIYDYSKDTDNTVRIKYILANDKTPDIPEKEKTAFEMNAAAYYITDLLKLEKIDPPQVYLNLELVLYNNVDSSELGTSIQDIVDKYSRSFLEKDLDEIVPEIKGQVEKISCIKYVKVCKFDHAESNEDNDKAWKIIPKYTVVS